MLLPWEHFLGFRSRVVQCEYVNCRDKDIPGVMGRVGRLILSIKDTLGWGEVLYIYWNLSTEDTGVG